MIARTSLKTAWKRSTITGKVSVISCLKVEQKRNFSCSYNTKSNNNNEKKKQETVTKSSTTQKPTSAPDIPSFMPVVNIPVTELAHNAFYSLHRPLLGLSTPRPFLAGSLVGQIKNEDNDCYSEEALLQFMAKLRPFEPPALDAVKEEAEKPNCSTTTLTVEVDPSYFLNHNNNHDEIADYLTAMQEKLDLLYDERAVRKLSHGNLVSKKRMRRLRKRSKGFFEKN